MIEQSRSSRARGLKQRFEVELLNKIKVALFTSAWIET